MQQKKFVEPVLKVIFLGGVGEIGKNMTALEFGEDIIIIDCGSTFPTSDTPGVDLIIPDPAYLLLNKDKIRGIVITHGHEDHIGSVPYFLKECNVPVYGTRLTLTLIENKLREMRIDNAKLNVVQPGNVISLGRAFKVEFVKVSHSIAGSCALSVSTPVGTVFHTGDFKVDYTPIDGNMIDLQRIAEIGKQGVLLLLCESTNVERPGTSMSEATVGRSMRNIFNENKDRRLIIATFASNIHRLQQIIDLAAEFGRKVAFSGRSMINVAECAARIGELKIDRSQIIDIEKVKNVDDKDLVILTTGSQGEPMSALTRMANGDNPAVTVGSNDTVIISASPIPGNEKLVYRVINNLYRKGADVVYESLEHIHVSGHACREEHKIMHTLLKPKYFIPVHGEYRHLKKHAALAEELGIFESRIFIPDIGDCVEVTSKGMRRLASVPAGSRLIDGEGIEDEKASTVIEDRLQLSEEGLFIVSVALSNGEVVGEPAINSRGFVFDFHRDYNKEMREVIARAIDGVNISRGGADELKKAIKRALRNYLMKKTKQSPMVVPVVVEL